MIAVAIDGPAGAGKSTIAKSVAKDTGFIYVDTGAMYRTLALYLMDHNVDIDNIDELQGSLNKINVSFQYIDGTQHMFLNGNDVTDKIRTPAVSAFASKVSAIQAVRKHLLGLQKGIAETNNVIMDGRDIGTVVLPDAQVKIFLSASLEERAKRRYKELTEKGESVAFDQILEDIKKRDYQDSHREIAPLKAADDAELIDTSDLTLEESIAVIRKKVEEYVENSN